MDLPIISVAMIKEKARLDHARASQSGRAATCTMPAHSPAAATWREEFARLEAETARNAAEEVAA